MPRYRNTLTTGKDDAALQQIITAFMRRQGFRLRQFETGETVWQRGRGWCFSPQYIKTTAEQSNVLVEAWIMYTPRPRSIRAYEVDFTDPMGFLLKSVLKNRVEALEKHLLARFEK